ncbi:hypothetical protein [Kitasatospora kifunensis]|uniref:Uncharacterized protein n=1 Tax=Kitasatospora kifunensis TaxID=58351 RepID=A0A7W7QWT1_KITKI|nr:hypothetical protein [Kitasatospora kifunensis]MBB4921231.1 hypothetical protein [Kitasatospora kifunensis]
MTDLQAGRWMSTGELLARTGGDRPLWTARSQVLAGAAARSDVLEYWAREDPDSTDLVMARVAVLRALAAARAAGPQAGAIHGSAQVSLLLSAPGGGRPTAAAWQRIGSANKAG